VELTEEGRVRRASGRRADTGEQRAEDRGGERRGIGQPSGSIKRGPILGSGPSLVFTANAIRFTH